MEGKRKRAATEGVKAWVDPEGWRPFIAGNGEGEKLMFGRVRNLNARVLWAAEVRKS